MHNLPTHRRIALFTLLALFLSLGQTAHAQGGDEVYFPQTGHSVSGEFLEFYQRISNPEFIYGYPITQPLIDALSGRTVQYFQRARFEHHLENPAGERVVLSPVGSLGYDRGNPIDLGVSNPACRFFGGQPYPVCYSFLDYYEKYGGQSQFGLPISGLEFYGERIVQWFEYARLEWHPEFRPGSQITLANLGRVYFDKRGEDPAHLQPIEDDRIFTTTDLKTRAFLEKAVVAQSGSQRVFVIVHNQNLAPVAGAQVTFVVRFPNGTSQSTLMPLTNEQGFTETTFPITFANLGVAEVFVSITYNGFTETIKTSFRIWY